MNIPNYILTILDGSRQTGRTSEVIIAPLRRLDPTKISAILRGGRAAAPPLWFRAPGTCRAGRVEDLSCMAS